MTVGVSLLPARRLPPADSLPHSSGGFTMLEIALVLFLMVGMLSMPTKGRRISAFPIVGFPAAAPNSVSSADT